jgi:hypothetical protein
MTKRFLPALCILLICSACYEPERNCQAFRNGRFTFSSEIGGETKTTTFLREDSIEIDYFEGKADTSSVRWINDCEYVVKKLHPTNAAEEKSIHMKILSTTENSYTFEYQIVGTSDKSSGTAHKTD